MPPSPGTLGSLGPLLREEVLGAPLHQLGLVMDTVLAQLGAALSLDRVSLHVHDGSVVRLTNIWQAVPSTPTDCADQSIDALEGILHDLRAGRPSDGTAGWLSGPGPRLVLPLLSMGDLIGHVELRGDAVALLPPTSVEEVAALVEAMANAWVRREARSSVGRAQARLEELLRHVEDVLLILDAEGRCTWASGSVSRLGLHPNQLEGVAVRGLLLDEDAARVVELVADWQRAPTTAPLELSELQLVTPLGIRWISATLRNLRHVPGIDGDLLTLHDITEHKHTLDTSRRNALTDALTRLPNRTWLHQHLERELSDVTPGVLGVLFLDLDRFKQVNDVRGHSVGDDLLRQAAARLQRLARDHERVARFGGDEFVVVLREETAAQVQAAAERFGRALASPYFLGGTIAEVTASMGLRLAQAGSDERVDALLGDADTALFVAKERGRDRLVVFDPEMAAVTARRTLVMSRLRQAVEQHRIVPHFQPIVHLGTGETMGVEALARWHDDELGSVSPGEFIPIAEETGLVQQLGLQMLTASAEAFAQWSTPLSVAVNVSARQLEDPDLARSIESILRGAGIPAHRVRLEVTESMLMRDPHRAAEVLGALRAAGSAIALDDFGTGHSSLAVLRDLPLDVLKIDRSFVSTLTEDSSSRHMVSTIIAMANHFGLETVAEGVEEPEQAEILRASGCDLSQGWLHGRPMPLEQLAEHLGTSVPASALRRQQEGTTRPSRPARAGRRAPSSPGAAAPTSG